MPLFELALALRTPVYELLENMSWAEYNLWMDFFNQRPIGWREDDRTFKQLRAAGVKANAESLFTSLAIMKQHDQAREKTNVPSNGSFMHMMMMSAKGGQKLDILEKL